jgi:hypothetical protein
LKNPIQYRESSIEYPVHPVYPFEVILSKIIFSYDHVIQTINDQIMGIQTADNAENQLSLHKKEYKQTVNVDFHVFLLYNRRVLE